MKKLLLGSVRHSDGWEARATRAGIAKSGQSYGRGSSSASSAGFQQKRKPLAKGGGEDNDHTEREESDNPPRLTARLSSKAS